MTKPAVSSSFRYTIRELTRPEGSEAVDRQTVSGWCTPLACACVNQVWNCVNGELGSNWSLSRAPLVYCSACELVLSFAGATMMLHCKSLTHLRTRGMMSPRLGGYNTYQLRCVLWRMESHF